MRLLRMAPWLLLGLLVLVDLTTLGAINIANVDWSLTPWAFTIAAAVLFAAGAIATWRAPRNVLASGICIASLVAIPSLFIMDGPGGFPLAPLVVVCAGVGALLVAVIVGNSTARRRWFTLTVIFCAITLLLLGGGTALAGFFHLYAVNDKFTGPRSADGWIFIGNEYNPGAMGSGSVEVDVRRDVLGVVRGERTVYSGQYARPSLGWAGPSEALIAGQRVDIFSSASIESSE